MLFRGCLLRVRLGPGALKDRRAVSGWSWSRLCLERPRETGEEGCSVPGECPLQQRTGLSQAWRGRGARAEGVKVIFKGRLESRINVTAV